MATPRAIRGHVPIRRDAGLARVPPFVYLYGECGLIAEHEARDLNALSSANGSSVRYRTLTRPIRRESVGATYTKWRRQGWRQISRKGGERCSLADLKTASPRSGGGSDETGGGAR